MSIHHIDEPPYSLGRIFMGYLFKQNGKGVKEFFKKDMDAIELAEEILIRSGLNPRASYYSGCGVNYNDLNQDKLISIYRKLINIEPKYALEFSKMVLKMKTLGATEFITSFKDLATSGFVSDKSKPSDSNISFDGVYGQARNAVALASVHAALGATLNATEQVAISEHIKLNFIRGIGCELLTLDPNLINEYYVARNWETPEEFTGKGKSKGIR